MLTLLVLGGVNPVGPGGLWGGGGGGGKWGAP